MTSIVVSFAAERFGVEEGKTTRPNYTMNQRADKTHQLWQELWTLSRQFKIATEEEKPSLAELHNIRKTLTTLHRAEWHRRWRRERARK